MQEKVTTCPLKFSGNLGLLVSSYNEEQFKCEKENCAWYIMDKNECPIKLLGLSAIGAYR